MHGSKKEGKYHDQNSRNDTHSLILLHNAHLPGRDGQGAANFISGNSGIEVVQYQ